MTTIKDKSLTPEVLKIIREKKTELPNTGEYTKYNKIGTYLCRGCGKALFRADAKFSSSCGWPSFDVAIKNALKEELDSDGERIEILCSYCNAHLGHVFDGEGFTKLNRRYCVNSLSLDFIENINIIDSSEAIIAAGCFWGVEHNFKKLKGVLKTEVGYIGGFVPQPEYQTVCTGTTGHFEAVRIIYSPEELTYKKLLKYFFEIHNPTQINGQGLDSGPQYMSAIFYSNIDEKKIAEELIQNLQKEGYKIVTKLLPVGTFWKAESYHQNYYDKN